LPSHFSRSIRFLVLVLFGLMAAACSAPGAGTTPGPAGPAAGAAGSLGSGAHPKPHRCIVTPTSGCGGGTLPPSPPPTGSSHDVVNRHGTLLTGVQSKVIYFGYQSSWGDQTALLKNLYASTFFAHLMAEYVPNHGAFTVAAPDYENAPIGYYDDQWFNEHAYYDVDAMLKAVAAVAGGNTGPHFLYHVITPGDLPYCSTNGVSCMQQKCGDIGTCTQTDCGAHYYGTPGDGNVFYTIQGGPGACSAFTDIGVTPLAIVTANTEQTLDSTVIHEVLESITDPYHGNPSPAQPNGQDYGWYGNGNEIGDVCQGFGATMDLNGTAYFAQSIWSNADQKCYYVPHPYIWPPIVLGAFHAGHKTRSGVESDDIRTPAAAL
jgi:hypothetical protein